MAGETNLDKLFKIDEARLNEGEVVFALSRIFAGKPA